jgi:hypothetical protein
MEEETLLSEVAAPETTTEEGATGTIEAPVDDTAWYLSEGVVGQGEAPDWFKAGKYATIADQAQAYNGLESKLGSFTGAPKDGYETVIPEGMNVEIPEGDALMENFNEWAQAAGLSQDAHSELLGVYLNGMAGEQPDMEAEMKRLGPDAGQRITDMVQWGKGNLDANEFETLQSMATTAEGFQLLERMKSFSRETQVSAPDTAQSVNSVTKEALYELIADERYESSASYRAEVEAKFKDFYGTGASKTVKQ